MRAGETTEMKKLYVGNLSFNTSEADLEAAFREYGACQSVAIITDRHTGQSKGFGFVEMENEQEADKAIEGLNGTQLDGRTLTVNEARPRTDRPGGRGGRGGGGRGGYGGGGGGRGNRDW
jgi:RNA recognition motif-containing protein